MTERLLASGIILFSSGLIWRWIYRGEGEAEIGFLPLLLIFFALEYAVPIFTLKFYSTQLFGGTIISNRAIEKSLWLAFVGEVCLTLGYYHPGRHRFAMSMPKIEMAWRSLSVVKVMSLFFALLGLSVFVITVQMDFSPETQAFVNRITDFYQLAVIALLALQLEHELGAGYVLLLWLFLIPFHAILGLAQGLLGYAFADAAALLITYATLKRRIPWGIFIVGLLAFFVVQPVKASLRSMVFTGGWVNREQDQSQKLEALAIAGQQGVAAVQTLNPTDLLAIATSRLASVVIMAKVIEQTPQDIPYWGGETYYPLLFVAIPRILYPEKPNVLPGNVLGHKYGMIQPEDYKTSINLMQTLDFYGNFGPLGVVIGSVVVGFLYRTINDLFIHRGTGLGAIVAGVYLFAHLLDIENAPAVIFGALLIESITVLIFHLAICGAETLWSLHKARRVIRRSGEFLEPEQSSQPI